MERIARRVGVAQPYVFSLFGSKKELFLAAVERGFAHVCKLFDDAAVQFDPAIAVPGADATWPIANAYLDQLEENRDLLLLQLWINVNAALGRVEPFCEWREWVRPEYRQARR